MNVLIIGSGGREHALYQKASENNTVYMLGNNGAIENKYLINDIDLFDFDQILNKINILNIDLTIVGPESYLSLGIVDFLKFHNKKVFGPNKKMSKLESSKYFAKEIMKRAKIPTAKYEYTKDLNRASKICDEFGYPVVIKYDGLAAGKGVLVAQNKEEADTFLNKCLEFGNDGVVIEECLFGDEYSVFVMIVDQQYKILPIAQDYKRVYDNDLGPNTGGMGANTTSVYNDQLPYIEENIIKPLIKELNYKYEGFLYIGLMQTNLGPKVIEFNVRMGDPECQVVMQKLDSDLVQSINYLLEGNGDFNIHTKNEEYVGVVLTSEGYPNDYQTNFDISYLNNIENVYHMGTKKVNDILYATGGRIAMITSSGITKKEAADDVYNILNKLLLKNIHYRKDIVYSKIDIEDIF